MWPSRAARRRRCWCSSPTSSVIADFFSMSASSRSLARKARATSCELPVPKMIETTPWVMSCPLRPRASTSFKRQLALIDLLLDLGGIFIADDVLQCVASNQGESGVAFAGCWPGCMTTPASSSSTRAW